MNTHFILRINDALILPIDIAGKILDLLTQGEQLDGYWDDDRRAIKSKAMDYTLTLVSKEKYQEYKARGALEAE